MEIVTEGTNKQIMVYARNPETQTVHLKQQVEQTGEIEEATAEAIGNGEQLTIILPFFYQVERNYYLEVAEYDGANRGEIINRSKIYCTNQTDLEKYNVIVDAYEEKPISDDNYYIVKGQKTS